MSVERLANLVHFLLCVNASAACGMAVSVGAGLALQPRQRGTLGLLGTGAAGAAGTGAFFATFRFLRRL